jgi:hypothetical protein
MGHVVQAFAPTWTETADVQFRGKQLKTTTKVNFALLQPKFLVLGFSKNTMKVLS